ncbi:MAG: glucose 1-dehydrogenase [Bryobacteraceae bacterium]
MELAGKVALITGGSHGIGRGAVDVFLREGARVMIADRVESPPAENQLFFQTDISKPSDARRAVEETVARFGRLDILVNNAGIQTYATAVEMEEELWDRTLDVNLKGAWWMTKFAVPEIRRQGGGAIVNVSSVQGMVSLRNSCAYGVSKHAMLGLTRTCALDYAADGIRVNCVCPGSVDTPMLRATIQANPDPPAFEAAINRMHPLGRMADPAEIGEVICFLASSRASFMTGSIVVVDGGLITTVGG